MCKEIMIIAGLKKKIIKELMKEYNIEGEIDDIALGCMDDETLPLVTIDGIDDQCFCNITTEQKERVFEFIYTISI